jgi:hypothetical protein
MTVYLGGCLCGSLQYQIDKQPIDAGYCHCRICQRSAGAPVLPWATFSISAFTYTRGKPSIYLSSEVHQREFCGNCGTQIVFRKIEHPNTIDVTIASLDDPEILAPEYHIWTQSQISWFEISDRLPHYRDASIDRH